MMAMVPSLWEHSYTAEVQMIIFIQQDHLNEPEFLS